MDDDINPGKSVVVVVLTVSARLSHNGEPDSLR